MSNDLQKVPPKWEEIKKHRCKLEVWCNLERQAAMINVLEHLRTDSPLKGVLETILTVLPPPEEWPMQPYRSILVTVSVEVNNGR